MLQNFKTFSLLNSFFLSFNIFFKADIFYFFTLETNKVVVVLFIGWWDLIAASAIIEPYLMNHTVFSEKIELAIYGGFID